MTYRLLGKSICGLTSIGSIVINFSLQQYFFVLSTKHCIKASFFHVNVNVLKKKATTNNDLFLYAPNPVSMRPRVLFGPPSMDYCSITFLKWATQKVHIWIPAQNAWQSISCTKILPTENVPNSYFGFVQTFSLKHSSFLTVQDSTCRSIIGSLNLEKYVLEFNHNTFSCAKKILRVYKSLTLHKLLW